MADLPSFTQGVKLMGLGNLGLMNGWGVPNHLGILLERIRIKDLFSRG
jgi:hypothetical protein